MSTDSPEIKIVEAELASTRFRVGAMRRRWRVISFSFPVLVISVRAVEIHGSSSEYFFRFEVSDFPGIPPQVQIWDTERNEVLEPSRRPKGSPRVVEAFKEWHNGSVYRPWERYGAQHNNWQMTHPDLAWHADRDLAFILEDLHGLLTSNAAAGSDRTSSETGL